RTHPRRGHREQQVGDRRLVTEVVADHLPHHAEPTGAGHHAPVGGELAGDDAQQRGLAGAVRPDQRDLGAVADAERHVLQQHAPVGQLVAHSGAVNVTHEQSLSATQRRRARGFLPDSYLAFSRSDDVRAPRTVRKAKAEAATTRPTSTSRLSVTAEAASNDGRTRGVSAVSTKPSVTVRTTTYCATAPAATPPSAAAPRTTTNSATTPIITERRFTPTTRSEAASRRRAGSWTARLAARPASASRITSTVTTTYSRRASAKASWSSTCRA